MKFRNIFTALLLMLAATCVAQQSDYGFGVFPRVTQARAYSGFFPLTGRDYARNAFLPIVSGSDTVVYFCDAYGRFLTIKPKPGGNGIYGGSGTVPSNVLATVTNRIRFLGADDFGADHPFKVQSDGNEPGIVALIANGDSAVISRSDVEFIFNGRPGLNAGSSAGDCDIFAGGFVSLGRGGADSLKMYTNSSLAVTVDESGNVGIGTDNPQTPLHVRGTSRLGVCDIRDVSNELVIGHSALSSPNTLFAFDQNQSGQTVFNGLDLNFRTSQNQRAIITSSGNFGVGTATPSTGFDVATNIRTRGVQVADFATITGTGGAVALSATITDNLYKPGSGQVATTFILPPSPTSGQLCRVTFFDSVASITWNYGGNGNFGAETLGAGVGASILFKYYTGSGWAEVVSKP